MSKKDKSDQSDERVDARQIVPHADDEALFAFLEEQFWISDGDAAPGKIKSGVDAFADRIVLRAALGNAAKDLGPIIFEQTWKPTTSPQPSREVLVELANTLLAKARHDCAQLGRRQRYVVQAFNRARSAQAIGRHLMAISPPREFEYDEQPDELEVDGTNASSLLRELYKDRRFLAEQSATMFRDYRDAMAQLIDKYEARLAKSEGANAELLKMSVEVVKMKEELLDKKLTRDLRLRAEEFKQKQIEEAVGMLKGLLPTVQAYMSRGKHGIVEGVRGFIDSLTGEQAERLFGAQVDGVRTRGILDEAQVALVDGVASGTVEPQRLGELVTSLRPEQLAAAQQVLSPTQIQQLGGLASAAQSAMNANGVA